MLNSILPEFYPYTAIVVGLLVILLILYWICYRYLDATNMLMIAFTAMVFVHLDLASYDWTYPLFQRFLDFFALNNINFTASVVIEIFALAILILPPILIWFIPMVMMDEKLTGHLCSKNAQIRIKSGIIMVFGIIINIIFMMAVFKSQGFHFYIG